MASVKTLSLKEIKDITDTLPKTYRLEAYRVLKNAKFSQDTKLNDLKLLKDYSQKFRLTVLTDLKKQETNLSGQIL